MADLDRLAGQGWAQVVGCAQIGGAVLAVTAAVLVAASTQPVIVAPTGRHTHTQPAPTGPPAPSVRYPKPDLIIQQNPHCWIGLPGATCGSERTYQ